MPLTPGQMLAQYRIEESIGAGGMGEVFRARDTKLGRDVALKVLPQGVARDEHVLARFEREARAVAAVSHPNILAIFDFVSEGEVSFVVTELLSGETLRERLDQGALAPRKAAEIGRQVARGLAAAHDAGIVHRDLKPENLFLTDDGRAKILDFGLAAQRDEAATAARDTEAATRTSLTTPGTVLGTVGYMSPEQVRGEAVDHRSDLFSFGAVLYEMVTGMRPFARDTHAETMTAILKEEPPEMGSAVGELPPALGAIVRRCLEKRAGERFQSAHDLAFSLEALSSASVPSGSAAVLGEAPAAGRRISAGLAAALCVAAVLVGASAAYLLSQVSDASEPLQFSRLSARRGTVTNARFEPGGETLLYSAAWDGGAVRVYPGRNGVRTSDPLFPGEAALLSVSSDGELALALDLRYPYGWEEIGTLAVTPTGATAPRRILEDVMAADWAPDGESLAVVHEVGGKVRVEYPIGTVLYEAPGWVSALRVHPDGERVLFADHPARGDNVSTAKIVDRAGKVQDLEISASWGIAWSPDGEAAWTASGSRIWSERPGEEPRAITSFPVATRLLDVDRSGRMLAAFAETRREMIVRAPGTTEDANLSWLDWSTPVDLSADGRHVLFVEGNLGSPEGYAIFLRGTDGGAPLQLGYGQPIALSPDGTEVAAIRGRIGLEQGLQLIPSGPGEPRNLDLGDLTVLSREAIWLPGALLFAARDADGANRFWRLPLAEGGVATPITPADFPLASQGYAAPDDGGSVVVTPVGGPAVRFPIDGGEGEPVPGLVADDRVLRFDADGRHLFVLERSQGRTSIVRLDTRTGERSSWRELRALDPAGVFVLDRVLVSADGSAYVYSNKRVISQLALVEGLH